ncbi:hypothetical protein BDQ12DRAFT_626793 [Crucibulum laeve]|uniref:Protein sym1 n=1 Tax=Crucibulum laeve TaxID=68775 RepID=A0A5C3MC16_9AGAR|nr:hypothetical protein BDQ12DRAFT_626793 [Crucibulum laeve]
MATLSLARAYQLSFDARPHSTLAVTGGCLNALGDFVAQVSSNVVCLGREEHEKRQPYDYVRTMRFFAFGVMISPMMGRWNTFLEHRFPLRSTLASGGKGKVSFKALSKRVAADQLMMAPVGLGLFLGSMGMMEGRSRRQISEKFRDLYPTAILANWKVWPAAQFVNFRFMPLPYRVPFSQTCGVFWTLYLSILNAKEDDKQDTRTAMRRTIDS